MKRRGNRTLEASHDSPSAKRRVGMTVWGAFLIERQSRR